jgi:Superinfection immunity protein
MAEVGDSTSETAGTQTTHGRRAVTMAGYFLLPLALVVTAPTSCAIAGGGSRCWSLAGWSTLVYPLWLIYTLPTGLALWREMTDWRKVAAVNVLAGWTVLGWVMALNRLGGARDAPSEGAEPGRPPSTATGPYPSGSPLPDMSLIPATVVAEPPSPAYEAIGTQEPPATDLAPTRPWAAVPGAPGWIRKGSWPPESLLVRLCGGFEAFTDIGRVSDEITGKPALLFLWLFLCLRSLSAPGSPNRRESLADEMSPGLDGRSQRRHLSNRLHDLSALDTALSRAVRSDVQAVTFDTNLAAGDGAYVVDVLLLRELAERGRQDTKYADWEVADVERLLEDCRGEVLPEWDALNDRIAKRRGTGDELIAYVRGRHTEDLATVSLALAQTFLETGSSSRAADLLRTILEYKPDREDVAHRLVAALTSAGRLSEADAVRGEYLS